MKNAIESTNSKLNQAEESICEVGDRSYNIIQSEGNKEKKIYIVPEGKEKEKGEESLFKEILTEKFPKSGVRFGHLSS